MSLDQLSAAIAPGTHVVLVWDGASNYSPSRALRCPANLTLATLQSYSPELDEVASLQLRRHHWFNRSYCDIWAVDAAAGSRPGESRMAA